VLALRSKLKGNAGLRGAAREAGVPIYAIKSSSSANLVRAFRTLLGQDPVAGGDYLTAASAALAAAGAGAGAARGEGVGGQGSSSGADSGGEEGSEDEGQQWGGPAAAAAAAASPTGRIPTGQHGGGEAGEALEEAQLALESLVLPLGQPVELLPRGEGVRQQQAALAGRYGCSVEAVGGGEDMRLRLLPPRWPANTSSSSSSGGGRGAADSDAGSSSSSSNSAETGAAVATSAVEG
jgi:hypothetical protein